MGLHVVGYTCYSAHCSNGPTWLVFVFIGVALVSALSHQGYRSRRGRRSIFGSYFTSYRDEQDLKDTAEYFREQALIDNARADHGLAPGGAPLQQGLGPAPIAGFPQSAQAHVVADPGGMVDATGMNQAAMAASTGAAPAGWYPDPERPGSMRYWSGTAWSPSGEAPPGAAAPPSV